jgi:hypothetical protein
MYDTLTFADLDGQHVELLPARTVLSLFVSGGIPDIPGHGSNGPGAGSTITNDGNGHTQHATHGIGAGGARGTAGHG